MRFTTLADWLRWQETLHPTAMDLGLDRVQAVLHTLALDGPPYRTVAVAGTNGKGSCVAFLEAMLLAGGHRVGAFTSPHLMRYNERIRVDGSDVTDAELIEAFSQTDSARGSTSLTYFEFSTIAALLIFRRRGVSIALLEVGLGGRLDAVNAVSADAAVVTSIGLDHQQWLGNDRDAIGYEKAGIFRPGVPAIIGDPAPPVTVLAYARSIGADLRRLGHELHIDNGKDGRWCYRGPTRELAGLPPPSLAGAAQYRNAACAIAVVEALFPTLPRAAVVSGLSGTRLRGRFEIHPGGVEWVLDVAHNPDAASGLAAGLAQHACAGRTHVVFAALADKDSAGMVRALRSVIDVWHLAGLPGERGQDAALLHQRAGLSRASVRLYDDVGSACAGAATASRPGDRVVVTGSFLTVAAAMKQLARHSADSAGYTRGD